MALEASIRALFQDCRILQTQVACSIRGPSVMAKFIRVPLMTASELEEHLELEMDHYLPSDGSDIDWDYHIPDRRRSAAPGTMMAVLLVAAKKEAVRQRVKLLQRTGLEPTVVDVDNLALVNMYTYNYSDNEPKGGLLINVSPGGVGMIVMHNGHPAFMREIAVGGEGYRDLMEETWRNHLQGAPTDVVSPGSDSQERLLSEVYRDVSKEVKKTIEYCCDMVPQDGIQKLFLCGGYAGLPRLASAIGGEVNLPLEFIDPFKKIEVPPDLPGRESLQSVGLLAGVAMGLAIRGMDG